MIEEVRVIHGEPGEYVQPVQRTPAQKHADEALANAAAKANEALESAQEALSWLEVVARPINRDVPTYIKKLVAEIAETKRLRQ